jgi:hypothetical protein
MNEQEVINPTHLRRFDEIKLRSNREGRHCRHTRLTALGRQDKGVGRKQWFWIFGMVAPEGSLDGLQSTVRLVVTKMISDIFSFVSRFLTILSRFGVSTTNNNGRSTGPTMPDDDPARRHDLSEASLLAQASVKEWARCALREVALQSLRADVVLDEERGTVEFRIGAIENARDLCNAVGLKWIEKIRGAGHLEAGEWIKNAMETESDAIFYSPAAASSDGEAFRLPREASPPHVTTIRSSNSVTTLARLQDLGVHRVADVLFEGESVQSAIQLVDCLAAENGTDWPYPWRLIQEKCDNLTTRLHNSKREQSELVVVPVSKLEGRGAHDPQQPLLEAQTDEAEEYILRRKRKSRHKLQQSTLVPQNDSIEGGNVALNCEAHAPTPRPASDVSRLSWSTGGRALSEADQKHLEESYIHRNEVSESPSTLLGSLSEAGRFHRFVKHSEEEATADSTNASGTSSSTGARTVRQLKWQKRVSINERLGNHRLANQDTRGASNTSHILRTLDEHGRHWLDFDLGHCLLDVEDAEPGGQGKRRKLLYFDSLELSLMDEDLDQINVF